jgi:hypothetical protein
MHPTAPSAHRAILIGSIGMGDRDRLERLIGIAGMLEGSNRSRVAGVAANSARDLFEA